MEEAGVPPLVISLVINIRTLIRPFLSHPGQLVVPDLVRVRWVRFIVTTNWRSLLTTGPIQPAFGWSQAPRAILLLTCKQQNMSTLSITSFNREIGGLRYAPKLPIFLHNFPRHHQFEDILGQVELLVNRMDRASLSIMEAISRKVVAQTARQWGSGFQQ